MTKKSERQQKEEKAIKSKNESVGINVFNIQGKSQTRTWQVDNEKLSSEGTDENLLKVHDAIFEGFEDFETQISRIEHWCNSFLQERLNLDELKPKTKKIQYGQASFSARTSIYYSIVNSKKRGGLGMNHDCDEALAALMLEHIDVMRIEYLPINQRLEAAVKLGETSKLLEIYQESSTSRSINAQQPRRDNDLDDIIWGLLDEKIDGETYKDLWPKFVYEVEGREVIKGESYICKYGEEGKETSISIKTFQNKLSDLKK